MFVDKHIPIYVGRRSSSSSATEHDNASIVIVGLAVAAFLVWAAYQGVRFLGVAAIFLARQVPNSTPDSIIYISVGAVVIISGKLLFLLRESRRAVYAYLELGSAVGAAVEACTRYGLEPTKPELLFALLGTVYISVRGFDNIEKAREEKRP